jgi:hypothetical protein
MLDECSEYTCMLTIDSKQQISICTLLKSLPAIPGMTSKQLYQHAEPNSNSEVTMVVYHKLNHDLVMAHQNTLEKELQSVLAPGQEENLLLSPDEGIWFGGVLRQKGGKILHSKQPSKQEMEHASRVSKMLHSPPKKRVVVPITTTTKGHVQPVQVGTHTPAALNTGKSATKTPIGHMLQKIQEEFSKHRDDFNKQKQ